MSGMGARHDDFFFTPENNNKKISPTTEQTYAIQLRIQLMAAALPRTGGEEKEG